MLHFFKRIQTYFQNGEVLAIESFFSQTLKYCFYKKLLHEKY